MQMGSHAFSLRIAMNLGHEAGALLAQLDVLRHPADLDLLIFFARHPRALLSSDHIAAFLGYAVKEVAVSLELLIDAGFVLRTPNPRHAARLFLFAATPSSGGPLSELKRLASTRHGRLALISELRRRSANAPGNPTQQGHWADTPVSAATAVLRFPPGPTAVGASQGRGNGTSRGAWSEPRKDAGRGGVR